MEFGKYIGTKEHKMKKIMLATILNLLGILIFSGCSSAVRVDGPYEGRVMDADTGQPIEGVVVLGVWYTEMATPAGATHKFYDARETVTDKNGEFYIQGMGTQILSNVIPMDVTIFKTGYEYLATPWESLKTSQYLIQKENIRWEGAKAIIPLKKLTIEERLKQVLPNIYLEERTEEGITNLYIPHNIKLIIKEINKEEESLRPKTIRRPTGSINSGR